MVLKEAANTEAYDISYFDKIILFLVCKGLSEPHSGVRKLLYESAATMISHVSSFTLHDYISFFRMVLAKSTLFCRCWKRA